MLNSRTYQYRDLTNKTFGRLYVICEQIPSIFKGATTWLCLCECMQVRYIRGSHLVAGKTISCGCWRRDNRISKNIIHNHAHRGKKHPLYGVWGRMIQRCHNENNKGYSNYGGRGIYVDVRWRNSFLQFVADMGPRPGSQYSIERIDNDGPYSPANCKWATRYEQSRNRRTNRFITIGDETKTISDWASQLNIAPSTFLRRTKQWKPEFWLNPVRIPLSQVK